MNSTFVFMVEIERELAEIKQHLLSYKERGLKMYATSSFQSHSIPMLHILSTIDRSIPIYFINTGFHFPETLAFRDRVSDMLGLNLVDQKSMVPKFQQKDQRGQFYFTSDPDYCCFLNKIQPLEPVLGAHDVWINGIRGDQNANRKGMGKEAKTPQGALRYHPMLNWNMKMIFNYAKEHNLPKHPLEAKGYLSIGCEPCTRKFELSNERGGRWYGMKKSECGLHTDLVEKK